ncbi:MAG TPA: hypothetical protein VGP86_01065 [Xanthobacteraceae bacterium]|jgi:hypothetical protein|nr:hypothetical protein [Xanthobacteraceae bacterium]
MRRLALIVLAGLLLAGCGPSERPPPPYFVIPPGPPPAAEAPPGEVHGGLPGPVIRPLPEVQQFLPGPSPDELGRGLPPVPQPGRSAGPYYTPQPTSPVTGYGTGGLAQPPGAPPNPPYPAHGLIPGP